MNHIHSSDMPNWFVALPIRLPPWYEVLNMPDGLRAFHPEDVHCTIAFLGNLHTHLVDDIVAQIYTITHPSFEISLDSPILLPSVSAFSALSFRIGQAHDTLSQLIAAQRVRLYEIAQVHADPREVLPHITFARPPRQFSTEQKRGLVRWCDTVDIKQDRILIDRVALYTWSDNRKERQFQIVASHALGSSA